MLILLSNYINDNGMLLINILNLFVLLTLIVLFVTTRKFGRNWNQVNDYLGIVTKTLNSVRYGDLTKKIENAELPNGEVQPLAESLNRMIESLSDREKMITEYQTELKRNNKLLEAILNSLSDGLIVFDGEQKILRATNKISEWFDVNGDKLINAQLSNYIQLPKDKNFNEIKDEDIIVLNDVSSTYTANCMELVLDDKKKRYVLILKNVTNQRELDNLKEDFVATLTHDLKVPIIAEKNMLELFLSESFGNISEKQQIALENMQSSNKELLDLVQTVLETYKLKGNKIRLYRENILLKGYISEIIEEMKPIADKTGNQIDFILSRDIRVFADKMQLKRVIKNLIQNAISYGKAKSPIIITIGEIPKYIVIKIKDFGAGISKTDIEKIFNRYYSAAKKFRKIGTGLGLYLSKQIIKAHGGDLTVDSIEGEYTEFCILLPATSNEALYYGE